MNIGKLAASIEIIVSVWSSVKLAESLGTFRWKSRIAKSVFYLAVLFRMGLGIANLHWSKFSDLGLLLFSLYLLMVILVFYQTNILKTIIFYSLYWLSIMMFQITYLFITAYTHSLVLKYYIYENRNVVYPYYGIHILGMCLEIAGIYLFGRSLKNKKILINCDIWFYVGCIAIIVCEIFIDYFFLDKMAFKRIESDLLFLELLLIWALLSIGFIMTTFFRYMQMKHQRNKIDMNMKLLSEQYEFMVRSYEEKRRQVHDNA